MQVDYQRDLLVKLEELAGQLYSRLSSVLLEDSPTTEKEKLLVEQLVPLAEAIRISNTRLEGVFGQLYNTFKRIEL